MLDLVPGPRGQGHLESFSFGPSPALWAQGSAGLGVWEDEGPRGRAAVSLWLPRSPGLPALVVAVSVGFTRTKGYGTSS